jgi:hypothetical protein
VHKEIEYQKPLARVPPEFPIIIIYYMVGIIVQVDFLLPGGIKINTAGRIKDKESYRKDPFSPNCFIKGS